MALFREKPVVIEAFHFSGQDKWERLQEFAPGKELQQFDSGTEPNGADFLIIDTLEGKMKANYGDWVIKGVANEFYPCKDDIFRATYDSVGEEDSDASR